MRSCTFLFPLLRRKVLKMRPPDNEPPQEEIEKTAAGEESKSLRNPNVPDDVKSEIEERLRRFGDEDVEDSRE